MFSRRALLALPAALLTAIAGARSQGARESDITPVGIQMSRDGKRAFVALGRANHVAFIDVPGRKVSDLVLVGNYTGSASRRSIDDTMAVVAKGDSGVDGKDLKTLNEFMHARGVSNIVVTRRPGS